AGPLYGYTDRAAHDLRARDPYIASVLPDGWRGTGQSPDVAEEETTGTEEAAGALPTGSSSGRNRG
ncbi:hypothetical protein PU560_01140, partial [Georgenia sp. 10Sc9-8]|nr:hypothetical protein [Georgenia halotolerans]